MWKALLFSLLAGFLLTACGGRIYCVYESRDEMVDAIVKEVRDGVPTKDEAFEE